jgi:hypothetical protein
VYNGVWLPASPLPSRQKGGLSASFMGRHGGVRFLPATPPSSAATAEFLPAAFRRRRFCRAASPPLAAAADIFR